MSSAKKNADICGGSHTGRSNGRRRVSEAGARAATAEEEERNPQGRRMDPPWKQGARMQSALSRFHSFLALVYPAVFHSRRSIRTNSARMIFLGCGPFLIAPQIIQKNGEQGLGARARQAAYPPPVFALIPEPWPPVFKLVRPCGRVPERECRCGFCGCDACRPRAR
jgi:hypothetical protein